MVSQALFQPLQIGNTVVKNRIGMAALTRNRSESTYPTDLMREYYVQRAGAGLILTEAILITRLGTEWPNAPGLWDEKHVAGWKNVVDGVHEAGSKIYAQLWHVGRVAHPDAPEQKLAGERVYAPSAIAARGGKFRHIPGEPGYGTPTAVEDPWTIVAQFKHAVTLAKKAGFDGVQIHGASGYIVNQFLDSSSNKRSDDWGGSPEKRSKFGLEVLKAAKEVFGADVAIKLNPCGGYNDMGMPLEEAISTYSYFIQEADKLGLSFFELVRYAAKMEVEYDGKPRSTQHDVLGTYRPFVKDAKLFLNADILPEEGEQLVASGKVDGVFIGLLFITHPDLVKRILHSKPLDNLPDFQRFQTNKSSADWRTGYTDESLLFTVFEPHFYATDRTVLI